MDRKVNLQFFWLLHLAFLRKLIIENKEDLARKVEKVGQDIGISLLDDFCARFSIFNNVEEDEVEKHLKLFLESYIGQTEIANKCVIFNHTLAKYQQKIGLVLLRSLLQAVFGCINSKVTFSIDKDKIKYSINQK